ncbi:MOSC domain-containing protein [Rhodoferax sp. OV413]|uniref:MOSC domain-containing protein n=1 Tax=Rhodoferax sp. OV413 TaxID=1855285 RepID=UPI000B85C99E|nr:MOSC N-terminal beta barrel domain-containing protein [Rhodoferax sp. OV413]
MDVSATITRLFVYPIKSCAGVELPQATLTETGLEFDRAWMVVDAQGVFVTQRELPRMALVQPELKTFEMVLRAPGMLALHIALDKVEQPVQATVWKDTVAAYDMGDVAAQWFSDFLGKSLRLVRFNPDHRRLSSAQWTGDAEGLNQFSDGYAVLVISEASLDGLNQRLAAAGEAEVGMQRFRPNIVLSGIDAHDEDRLDELLVTTAQGEARLRMVKPCPRCPIPNIDPRTAISTPTVGDMLQTYRQTAVVGGAVAFGMNAIVLDGVDFELRTGQAAAADYKFD